MREDIKVLFMGTPEFAACSLKSLVDASYNVVGCFTNPDKPAGRGMKIKHSEVKQYALDNNIPVYQPVKVRNNPEVLDILNDLKPDIIVVVAYGKILPKEILDFPRLGCVNVHGSLLPKYRGAAPIQWSIIQGEKITGITTMFMDEGMDTGDMLLKAEVEITDNDNFETLHDKLKVVGANLLVETLDGICNGTIERKKQPIEGSLAPMIKKDMTKIDFNKTAKEIYNFVRGLSPFPGTYIEDSKINRYKIYKVSIADKNIIDINSYKNGEIIYLNKDKLLIKCADSVISIDEIQPQNSKRMNITAFLAGNKINPNEVFA